MYLNTMKVYFSHKRCSYMTERYMPISTHVLISVSWNVNLTFAVFAVNSKYIPKGSKCINVELLKFVCVVCT